MPKEFLWTNKGVLSRVRRQNQCGACWAITVVEALESAYAIKTGKLYELSE
jgi:C1A family cysteine protease